MIVTYVPLHLAVTRVNRTPSCDSTLPQSAGTFDDMQDVSASKKPEKDIAKGQAGSIKARFEKMGAQESEVRCRRPWGGGG